MGNIFTSLSFIIGLVGITMCIVNIVRLCKERRASREQEISTFTINTTNHQRMDEWTTPQPRVDTITVDGITYRRGSVIGYNGVRTRQSFTITDINASRVYFIFDQHPLEPFDITRGAFHFAFQEGDFTHIRKGIKPTKEFQTHKFI